MATIANYICIETKCLWPGVVLHASLNLFVQNIFDVVTVNKTYTQYVTTEFGVGLAIVYCVIAIVLLTKYA